jgi:hypothetical protein
MSADKMTDDELLNLIESADSDAQGYATLLKSINDNNEDFYNCAPWNEQRGRSKVISTDVYDVVEAPQPAIVRMFMSAKQIHKFKPRNSLNKADKAEADEKTEYINWIIRNQNDSYRLYTGWMKEALIKQASILTYEYCEDEEVLEREYEGISQDEFIKLLMDLDADKDTDYEVLEQENDEDGISLKLRTTTYKRQYVVSPVDPDAFRISSTAINKDDADIVGHDQVVRRGDLIAKGYDPELVEALPRSTHLFSGTYYETATTTNDPANDLIVLSYRYPKIDYDRDGIPERRKIVYSSRTVFENESFNHVPYAILSSVIMPRKAIGKSLAEVTTKTQEVKSTLLRGVLDNTYEVNTGRVVVNTAQETNVDDVLTNRHRGIIRTKGDPRTAVAALETPFVADKVLGVIQYMDFARSQRTGTLMASQGLNSDGLQDETATRFSGVQDEGQEKILLIARNFAETGWRELYEGLAWLVSHCQNERMEIEVLGKPLTVNPALWRYNHKVDTEIGLGSGSDDEQASALMTIYQIQRDLLANGAPITDWAKVYNTLNEAMRTLGFKDTKPYFNNPEVPEEMAQQAIQTLQAQLDQALTALEQKNPLAEAEQIRAQAKLMETQIKEQSVAQQKQIDMAKLVQDQNQFNRTLQEEQRQFNANILTKLNELEMQYRKEITNQVPKV